MGYGEVWFQTGNNAGANLHGLNKDLAPAEMKTFAPVLFWQDQGNSRVVYTPKGGIDTSCGSTTNLQLYGALYQPCASAKRGLASKPPRFGGFVACTRFACGGALDFQGNGGIGGPIQIITGAVTMQGGPALNLHRLQNPVSRRVVALVE